ncbi:hypothetical protein RFI_18206, partial [Reticulomyxa filosa]
MNKIGIATATTTTTTTTTTMTTASAAIAATTATIATTTTTTTTATNASMTPSRNSKDRIMSARPSLAHAIGVPANKSGMQKQQNEAIKNMLLHVIFAEVNMMEADSTKYQEEKLKPLLDKMKDYFVECDKAKRGALDRKEFAEWLEKCGLHLFTDDIDTVFAIFDVHGTGLVDYRQFMKNFVPKSVPGVPAPTLPDLLKHTITVHFGVR